MVSFSQFLDVFQFMFFLTSPLTSYGDQILSMHRSKSSAGFSIDVCGIMLHARHTPTSPAPASPPDLIRMPSWPVFLQTANIILRVFFWFGDRYELSLLGQAILMIFVQFALLKMCLDYRPNPILASHSRPMNFWSWTNPRTYWDYVSSFIVTLIVLHLLVGTSPTYITLLGMLGLGIEAVLPIPQFLTHYRHKSVSGFRPSVIVAWLLGDLFKCSYFFLGAANVSWQFKACALVQISFDLGIAVQFCVYGERHAWSANGSVIKHIEEEEMEEGLTGR